MNNFISIFLLISLFQLNLCAEKVILFTYSYNRPDFIEIQYKTFHKFLKDDFEFIVFNDASTKKMAARIKNKCKELKIRCIRIPQSIHTRPYLERDVGDDCNNPSVRNCNVVQYSLDKLGFSYAGKVAIFDSDMFLIKDFSILEYMKDYDLAGSFQIRKNEYNSVEYLWIGLIFFDFSTLPQRKSLNFNCGLVDGVRTDTGGYSYYYLKNNPAIRLGRINSLSLPIAVCDDCREKDFCVHSTAKLRDLGFADPEIKFIQSGPLNSEFFLDHTFLHYRAGTNWDNRLKDYHLHKTQIFNEFFNDLLNP